MTCFAVVLSLSLVSYIMAGVAYDPDGDDSADYIHTLGATHWGFWGAIERCPNESYAYGFEIMVEEEHGALDDDTSLNAIQLFCRTKDGIHTGEITSATMDRGVWTGSHHCHKGFLHSYDLKCEQDGGIFHDNTAANGIRMWCTGDQEPIEATGNKWGEYIGRSTCPSGKAICGIITLVQDDQGTFNDDTALNDVKFLCCHL